MTRDDASPLYFITGNAGKFAEVRALVTEVERLDLDLAEIQEFDARRIVTAKLAEARRHHAGAFLVEDTSLYLDALNGLPGPFIKWFLDRLGDAGIARLALTLGNDRARARTVLGYSAQDGQITLFEGEVTGTIVTPRGDRGFGWDKIFVPDGAEASFGQLEPEQKQAFSMRRMAVERFIAYYRARA